MKRNLSLQISEIKQLQASFCLPRDTGRRHIHRACQEEDRHRHGRGLHPQVPRHQPVRHPRQARHHHAQGHPARQEDPWREGIARALLP
jgi:hypothetical protein